MATAGSSPITSRAPQVEFTDRFVQPPTSLYVFRDDLLFIRSQSSSANRELRLRGRILTPAGEIITLDFVHFAGTVSFAPELQAFDLLEGFFLGLAIVPTILTGRRGEIFVTVGIMRGGTLVPAITQILFSGYIEGAKSQSWPTGTIESSVAGPGRLHAPLGVDPAAGAELTHTVPEFVRWRIISMTFNLVADATAINRLPKIEVEVNAARVALAPADAVQVASTTISYTAGHFGGRGSALGGAMLIPLPEHLILQDGDIIRTVTDSLQAGDNYGAPRFYVEEWKQEF